MIVAHLSQTPLGGAVWAAAAAFREAGHDSFCIAPEGYLNGRAMATDYRYPPAGAAAAKLAGADVIVCHDGRPYREPWYPAGKPTVGWYHSDPRTGRADLSLEADGWPWGVTGNRRTRLYPGARPLPQLYPLRHRFYALAEKPAGRVRIACGPFDAAGSDSAAAVEPIRAAAADLDAKLDVIRGASLAEELRRKAAAHLVIGDCLTGSYDRPSLDGLTLGCVVVNRCDGLCAWHIQRMTGGCGHPFEVTDPAHLRQTLRRLISCGPEVLAHLGRRNRQWVETAWGPAGLIGRNFEPLVETALAEAQSRTDAGAVCTGAAR
jgi:hypothetical protein